MLRTLHMLVLAVVTTLGVASSAAAVTAETALRADRAISQPRVQGFGQQARETHQQSRLGYGGCASDACLAAKGVPKSVGAAAKKGNFAPSPNQMNQAIKRGQAPSGIKRVDVGKVKGEQPHVHFDDGAALNVDGTWKHGSTTPTNAQLKWLREHGWTPPTP